ncbi:MULTISPECIES: CGNR zinc finger domain-containing protein [unclassified Leifsonia]|uniref:CGNR zinc finger domain-containing protein n=1 Tax=unclassified Leifsonia TaxID=2663824 RepID=UPI0006F52164|nr:MULTISPECIES: CGNR zinc finger domain-containing protein [unclassified Leifsonia]KQX06535.1 hypothetical protein ASC59_01340 [Leifsonia sp. Root1293]KRA10818.1 hypothetical protein ASD61_01340 [Leifsonia sp. Root60]
MTDGGNVLTADGSGSVGLEDLVVDFLNTLDVEDATDELATEDGLQSWAAGRGLLPGELAEVRSLRDALRAVASGEDAELTGVPVRIGVSARSVALTPETVTQAVLANAAVLGIQGKLGRVKLCSAHDCAWAFYDRSRNGSRTWCEMGVCGNRAKARTFRARASR